MKKLIMWGMILIVSIGIIWLWGDDPEDVQAQYGAENLKNVYSSSSSATVIDNANGTTTIVMPLALSATYGGHGNLWGSVCMYIKADTIKASTSQQDSLQIWYKELKSYTSSSSYEVSYYDSTSVTSNFDWDSGKLKKYSIASDPCYGYEFRVSHATTADDSIQVTITLVYQ